MADLFTEDILELVFSNLGPQGSSNCAAVCRTWKRVVYQSKSMWRHFCQRTFGFSDGNPLADWRLVYAYLTTKAQEPQQLLQEDVMEVVFADDGGGFLFFKANRVIKHNELAWCTNTDVNENVDLVLRAKIPALVSGFAVRNPGNDYSAPLHQALVFASYNTIDLDAARAFDGSNGESWVKELEGAEDDRVGQEQFLLETTLHIQTHFLESITNTRGLEPISPSHEGMDRTTTTSSSTKQQTQTQSQSQILKPLAAFRTAPLPLAYTAFLTRRTAPTVARNIHFKLLNSHKAPGIVADNIDVLSLLTYGVPMPELTRLTGTENTPPPEIPNYKRTHTLREVEPEVAMLFEV